MVSEKVAEAKWHSMIEKGRVGGTLDWFGRPMWTSNYSMFWQHGALRAEVRQTASVLDERHVEEARSSAWLSASGCWAGC